MSSAEPVNRLEAMRSRIAGSAVYVHSFEIGSVPFQIAAGMICSNHRDEKNAAGYIRLANGKTDAASFGTTQGYSIRVPDIVEAAASGCLVSVNVVARAAGCAQSRFAVAYSTNEVGNSGWRWQDAGAEWSVFTIEYDVPVMKNGNGDFIGILPDGNGRPGTEFCFLSVNMMTGDAEFPSDLLDDCWYAEYLNFLRDLPRETRFIKSLQHYLETGGRQRRDPNPLFDSKWYAKKYQLPADQDPLVHYATHEKFGLVSPNRHWETVSATNKLTNPPPPLSRLLHHYPTARKPTYLLGLFGTGRQYLNSLFLKSNLEIAYYFRDCCHNYFGAVPVIFSGHVASTYERVGFRTPDFWRTLIERAAAGLVNLIFIYRHPLDSVLSNWAYFHHLKKTGVPRGIARGYKAAEDFHRDLNDNIYEFSLFCGGSQDFPRVLAGSYGKGGFMSLFEFIRETEVFVSNPNVHCFRFEDFQRDATAEFKRLVSILAPNLTHQVDHAASPEASSSRYQSAKENVTSFRALMDSLPADVKKRIMALGYSV
jgi:hypothetical protein